MPNGRPLAPLALSFAEKEQLAGWGRRPKGAQPLAMRARIVLRSGAGHCNTEAARQRTVSLPTPERCGNAFWNAASKDQNINYSRAFFKIRPLAKPGRRLALAEKRIDSQFHCIFTLLERYRIRFSPPPLP